MVLRGFFMLKYSAYLRDDNQVVLSLFLEEAVSSLPLT